MTIQLENRITSIRSKFVSILGNAVYRTGQYCTDHITIAGKILIIEWHMAASKWNLIITKAEFNGQTRDRSIRMRL